MTVLNEVSRGQQLANVKMAEGMNPDIRTHYPYQLFTNTSCWWGGPAATTLLQENSCMLLVVLATIDSVCVTLQNCVMEVYTSKIFFN
jgi:hypothetical protein